MYIFTERSPVQGFLAIAGLLSIGMAIVFTYGIGFATGIMFGPIHQITPFMLLGIGVDDMFVMMEAVRQLSPEERALCVEERIGLALKHARVSITVTSITDIVAFAIGGSTVIPSLSTFCVYAAIDVLALYILQATFFVACVTLDEQRNDARRNACCICVKHDVKYKPGKYIDFSIQHEFMRRYWGPFVTKIPVKAGIIIIAVGLSSLIIWSFLQIKKDFDPSMYLPSDSYSQKFVNADRKYFPDDGAFVKLYCGTPDLFSQLLYFLTTDNGRVYWPFLRFDKLQNQRKFWYSANPTKILASSLTFRHVKCTSSICNIQAMDEIREMTDQLSFNGGGHCFVYSTPQYMVNETNKMLKLELYRNLLLAAVCVFVVTLILIANLWTSVLVFVCVVYTVIDVAGMMQFWDISIDTASSVFLILCVGLAVDYSAHVGHTFMTHTGSKNERTMKTLVHIGFAVFSGGFSTFLAFVLLVNSISFGMMLFFKIFTAVVIFGLFHGLVFLPVILSIVGPKPYDRRFLSPLDTVPSNTNVDMDYELHFYSGSDYEQLSNGSLVEIPYLGPDSPDRLAADPRGT